MTRYAADTSVPSERSRAEIETTLRRYGATGFGYGWDERRATIGFTTKDRQVRFVLLLPDRNDFILTPGKGQRRTSAAADQAWEQAVRQCWRALALVVKAKLEAVAAGITTFEEEFLAHIVLPDGRTVAEHVIPGVALSYERGRVGPLLPALEGPR